MASAGEIEGLKGRTIVEVEDRRSRSEADEFVLVLDNGARVSFTTYSDANYYRDNLVIEVTQ